MSNHSTLDPAVENQRTFEKISALFVCLMMTCVGVSITQLGVRMMPGWRAGVLPVLTFLVALERISTHKRVKRMVIFSKPWIIFQITQWVVILLIMKVALLAASPPESWIVEFQLWRIDFFGRFLDSPTIYSILFVVIIWMVTGYFASLLDEMSLEEALIRYETAVVAPSEGAPARERLLGAVFVLGFILVAFTAILRLNLRALLEGGQSFGELVTPLPYLAAGAWNVLLYFLFGLGLMSLSQFARMNARWSFLKIEVKPYLARHWVGYSLGFIFLLAFATSLLPTNYSLGLLSSIAQVLMFVYGIVLYIVGFLFSILMFLIGLISNLLGIRPMESESQPPLRFTPPEMPENTIPDGVNPWWDLIKSLVFWIVFLGLVGYSVYTFTKQHEDFLRSLRRVRIMSWFVGAWQYLKRLWKGVNLQISTVIDAGLERFRSRDQAEQTQGVRQFFQYRRLNDRQRILLTFFTMMRKGSQRGINRVTSQTPYEYANELKTSIPETGDEIMGVTDAFVLVRYSKKDIDGDRASLVRRYWTKIRSALKSLKR